MIYRIQARFNQNKAKEFYTKLTNGTIEKQQPDGRAIVDGMNRAVVDASGLIHWSELCYCNPPLAHERATVLDHYFSDIETEPIGTSQEYVGESFMKYLSQF